MAYNIDWNVGHVVCRFFAVILIIIKILHSGFI